MLKGLIAAIRGYNPTSEDERRVYEAEKENNFRWVSQVFAPRAPFTLTAANLIQDVALQNELSEIGQFAEVAHGSFNPTFIWKHMPNLSAPGYPLEQYTALSGSRLCSESAFHGAFADLQGYIAHRPDKGQLVVAFSGTSSLTQALQSLKFPMVPHPSGTGRVHSGFWRMYSGIRTTALSQLSEALKSPGVTEVVFTGHSMGAVISYLFCLDVLEGKSDLDPEKYSGRFKVVAFGAPRVGDEAFARRWSELTSKYNVVEHSVRNYRDGVPSLPPQSLGYRHLSGNPLYLAHGHLWSIPPAQSEYSLFTCDTTTIRNMVDPFPFGGHNYYSGRDMELLQRQMKWFGPYMEAEKWDVLKKRSCG
ncbi:Alpha/Beta hydrolase protein [Lyophyllum atratum]|nr:Alpha/Beta hydrolase protein [Lyophyllum atratum]